MSDFTIEDFATASYPVLKNYRELFEVAQFRKDTMKGTQLLPTKDIVFKPLENSYALDVFSRIREYSTPNLIKVEMGYVLMWDNYIMRLKK